MDLAADRRSRTDDQGDADGEHGRRGGTGRRVTRIVDLLAEGPTLSVEFFPPKTPTGMAQLDKTIGELAPLDLSFVSVTYGAGGSTRDTTRDIVVRVNEEQAFPAMPHLTCMSHTVDEIDVAARRLRRQRRREHPGVGGRSARRRLPRDR